MIIPKLGFLYKEKCEYIPKPIGTFIGFMIEMISRLPQTQYTRVTLTVNAGAVGYGAILNGAITVDHYRLI